MEAKDEMSTRPAPTFTLDGRTIEQRLFNVDDTLHAAAHGLELMEHWPFERNDHEALGRLAQGHVQDLPRDLKQSVGKQQHMGLRIMCAFGPATTLALQSLRTVAPGFNEWWSPRSAQLRNDPLARFFWDMRVEIAHRGSGGAYNIATHSSSTYGEGQLPVQSGFVALEFLEVPAGYETDAYELGAQYLELLGMIVSEAWAEFSPETASLGDRQSLQSAAFLTVSPDAGESVTYELEKLGFTEA